MISCLVVVNPASGGGLARKRAAILCRGLSRSCRVAVIETRHRGDAAEMTARRGMDVDRVVAVGGDGTLNEVLNGLMRIGTGAHDRPELGFLPAGTANVAVQAFGFVQNPAAAVKFFLETDSRPVDVGVARFNDGERAFLLWLGAGFDAVVIDALNASRTGRMGLPGLIYGLPRMTAALGRYAAPPISVSVDGAFLGVAASVILANVRVMAFGAVVDGSADPFDGRLDVVAVPPGSRLNLLRLVRHMMTSGLSTLHGVRHRSGIRIRLAADDRVPLQLDGEPAGVLPAAVRLERGAVRLLLT